MVFPAAAALALGVAACGPPAAAAPTVRVRIYSKYALNEAVLVSEDGSYTVRLEGKDPRLAEGLRVEFPSGRFYVQAPGVAPRLFAGALEAALRSGKLELVDELGLEDYVAGVTAGEAGGILEAEALKAQAVAVRSFALAERGRHEGHEFCDLTHCQVFPGLARIPEAVRRAAEETAGEVLEKDGTVMAGYYHAACGGETESASGVWGRGGPPGVRDLDGRGRAFCRESPHFRWRALLPARDAEALAAENGWLRAGEGVRSIGVAERTAAGRALRVVFFGRGAGTQAEVSAQDFFRAAGRALGWSAVKSTAFTVRAVRGGFLLEGRGLGHGVGLCQAGAQGMARAGYGYRGILAHYFPTARVARIGDSASSAGPAPPSRARDRLAPALAPDERGTARCSAHFCLRGETPESDRLLGLLEREYAPLPELPPRITVAVYRDFDAFRRGSRGTGRLAARWRGGVLHLAPIARLDELGILEPVLRHELTHLWVRRLSRGRAPRWLAEGVCVWRAGESDRPPPEGERAVLRGPRGLRWTYRQAGARVAAYAARQGNDAVERLLREFGRGRRDSPPRDL